MLLAAHLMLSPLLRRTPSAESTLQGLFLTSNKEEDDSGCDEQLLEARLLPDPEDEPSDRKPDDHAKDTGNRNSLCLNDKEVGPETGNTK